MRSLCFAAAIAALVSGASALPAMAQSKWQDSPQVKQLYEAAKKEGEVIVWGVNSSEVDWIPAAFGKMFPGIAVKILGDTDIATKAIAEARAGRHEVDVFQTSFTVGRPLLERNMYAKIDWSIFGTPPDAVAFDGRALMTHNQVYGLVYNTTLVKPEDLPKSWEQLLEPRYREKFVGSSFLVPRMIGGLGLAWGEEKMLRFTRGVIDNKILITRSPPQTFLQSGERPFAFASFISQAQEWARQGIPVDYVIPEPVIATQLIATVIEKAPHPSAARLMAGYFSSAEGRAARKGYNFAVDVRKGSDDPLAKRLWASNVSMVFDRTEDIVLRESLIEKVNRIVAGQSR